MGKRMPVWGLALAVGLAGCEAGAEAGVAEGRGAPATAATAPTAATAAKEATVDESQRRGPSAALHPALRAYVERAIEGFDAIPEARRRELRKLALFVRTKRSAGEPANLTFICTHNSRRSHMGQLWAATAASWYGVDGVGTFSGGTEATAFNPRAVAALERAGFEIARPEGDAANPRYRVTFGPDSPPIESFSKVYDAPGNPTEGFAAVMTCSEADKNCPLVAGAALRVAIPYVDPKEADDTPAETARYDERARQIATEMFYLFSQV